MFFTVRIIIQLIGILLLFGMNILEKLQQNFMLFEKAPHNRNSSDRKIALEKRYLQKNHSLISSFETVQNEMNTNLRNCGPPVPMACDVWPLARNVNCRSMGSSSD